MQGLAHNLSIRWMDGPGSAAEGGTENAEMSSNVTEGVGVQNMPQPVAGAGSSCLTNLSPTTENGMCGGLF